MRDIQQEDQGGDEEEAADGQSFASAERRAGRGFDGVAFHPATTPVDVEPASNTQPLHFFVSIGPTDQVGTYFLADSSFRGERGCLHY